MATIAIRIDDDEPDRKEHTSCIDRWTDKGLALLTFFGGNGRAKSKAGVAWKYIARILAVLAGPTDTVTKLLDPCEEESCADSNNFDDLYVWPALFIFLNFALILIGVRRNKPENNQLIFDERVVNRGRVARTIRTVLVVIAVGQVLSIPLGAVEFGKYSDMKDAGKRVAATILNSMSEIGFMCMLANFFDGIGNAGAWLRATRKVVTRFANEVQAASDAANDLVPCPAAVEVMPIGENAGVGGAVAVSAEVSAVEIGTANDKQLAAQAKIKSSFGAAWRMVQTTNRIFVSYDECGVCALSNAVVAQVSRVSFARGSHPAFVLSGARIRSRAVWATAAPSARITGRPRAPQEAAAATATARDIAATSVRLPGIVVWAAATPRALSIAGITGRPLAKQGAAAATARARATMATRP